MTGREVSLKRVPVTIQKSKRTRRLNFVDFKGNTRYTSRKEWKKVDGGYELVGRKYVYFATGFP